MKQIPAFIRNIVKLTAYIFAGVFSLFGAFFISFVVLIALAAGMSADDGVVTQESLMFEHAAGPLDARHTFASIPISGLILGEPEELPSYYDLFSELGIVYGYEVKETLMELAEQEDIEGVILELHTPGGTIYGTAAIADGVDYYQAKTGKPVLAYVGSVAASGGYWIAASADEIAADHGTTIGSIGVIAGPFKYYDGVIEENGGLLGGGVTTSDGISTEYITGGRSKDLGNPYRPLTDEERDTLQAGANNAYDKFVAYISSQREISKEKLTDQIGALIYDETQAVELGLIDKNLNRDQAYIRLAELAGVDADDFQIQKVKNAGGFWDAVFSSAQGLGNSDKAIALPGFCHERTAVLAFSGNISAICR